MSETLLRVKSLAERGEVEVSRHGLRELATRGIVLDDIVDGINVAIVVEDYPDVWKGPSVLVLQRDGDGRPVHIVWGIPRNAEGPVVLVTAYRPDPERWSADFMRRKT
jgi:Domain of unknown function (DUF4258)